MLHRFTVISVSVFKNVDLLRPNLDVISSLIYGLDKYSHKLPKVFWQLQYQGIN